MQQGPTLQAERVGTRKGRALALTTGLSLLLAACTASTEPIPEPPETTEYANTVPLLYPQKVGRVVLFFVRTDDSKTLRPEMREAFPRAAARAVRDFRRSTLGLLPQIPVVDAGNFSIKAPPLTDRCNPRAKDALAQAITTNTVTAAKAAERYNPRKNDFTFVIMAAGKPCPGKNIAGVADNKARAGILYDGNDEYESPTTLTHELGHGFVGAGHSHKLECQEGLGGDGRLCTRTLGGDVHSVMGDGSFIDRDLLSGWELLRLGRIPSSRIKNITQAGDVDVTLRALLTRRQKPGVRLVKAPIASAQLRDALNASHYLIELSGSFVHEDEEGCMSAIACIHQALPRQRVSVKVYAISERSGNLYEDSTQVALNEETIERSETGATQAQVGKTIFNDGSLQIALCSLTTTTRATGLAKIRLRFQETARLMCP